MKENILYTKKCVCLEEVSSFLCLPHRGSFLRIFKDSYID